MVILSVAAGAEAGGVVLVLSGGGTRGLAHIGVLKVLEERGIKIDGIVGTSIGSIVGGLAACGYSSAELNDIIVTLDLPSLLYDFQREADAPPGEEASASAQSLLRMEFNDRGHLTGPLGGLSGKKLLAKLQEWTSRCHVLDFSDLPIPFAAVATDIVTGEAVVLRRGNLASAMRASMAVPGLFSPWTVDGRLLVDGGLVSNAPVLIAREIFPDRPVILVDVTGQGKGREDIHSVIDVLDQMITIMTKRNVQEEIKFADLVITPKVGELPMLDTVGYDQIVKAGEMAASASLGSIEKIVAQSGEVHAMKTSDPVMVVDVQVRTSDGVLSRDLHGLYSDWIGRVADPAEIVEACTILRNRDDVRTADFWLEYQPDGNAVVVLNVEKEPAWEIAVSGHATNLSPYSAIYLDIIRRDLFSEGDSLRSYIGIGEQLQFASRYLSPVQGGYRRWEISAKAGQRDISPAGGIGVEWDQYSMSASRLYSSGSFRASMGYAGEIINFNGQDHTFSGPTLTLAWEGLDDPIDPTEGFSTSMSLWWRDTSSLLARMDMLGVVPLGGNWRLFARGGAISGDETRPYHSAYLGAREELFSLAWHPLAAENAAWGGINLRRVFQKSWWGTINMDLFATVGKTYDSSWEELDNVWETGLSLSLPGRFFNGKILAVYDDHSEWTFGFIIGRPLWESDPLP